MGTTGKNSDKMTAWHKSSLHEVRVIIGVSECADTRAYKKQDKSLLGQRRFFHNTQKNAELSRNCSRCHVFQAQQQFQRGWLFQILSFIAESTDGKFTEKRKSSPIPNVRSTCFRVVVTVLVSHFTKRAVGRSARKAFFKYNRQYRRHERPRNSDGEMLGERVTGIPSPVRCRRWGRGLIPNTGRTKRFSCPPILYFYLPLPSPSPPFSLSYLASCRKDRWTVESRAAAHWSAGRPFLSVSFPSRSSVTYIRRTNCSSSVRFRSHLGFNFFLGNFFYWSTAGSGE